MKSAKEILRLDAKGISQRDIASAVNCSLGTVNTVLTKVKDANIKDPFSLSQKELGSIIYPPTTGNRKAKSEPDLQYVHRELQRKGVTLLLLWEEYKTEHPDGLMYTQFCDRYNNFKEQNDVSYHKVYKSGEQMMVDWAGLTMQYHDKFGVEHKVYIFVATLPASSFVYAQACLDMAIESWIDAHNKAFEYFGGVPLILVPDNTKTAVIKSDRYDPVMNKTYQEMASYYGSAIIPARVYKPQDKASVEKHVQFVEGKIIAPVRNKQFFTFDEVYESVQNSLEMLNDLPFQKMNGTRRSVFLETEKDKLIPLPSQRYEFATWKKMRCTFDYHIQYEEHYYSVPYQYVGKQVEIRASARVIEVFHEGERIASHVRCYDSYRRYISETEHMPENHKAVTGWSEERFRSWAAKIGVNTEKYIVTLMSKRDVPQQAYKTCIGILNMASTVTKEKMEMVCSIAMTQNIFSYKYFHALLKSKDKVDTTPIAHNNIRGAEYYAGGNNA